MRDDTRTTSTTDPAEPGPPTDDAADAAQAAELSRAAREAVHQPADPRIDRQLARMGLADDPAATGAEAERGAVRAGTGADGDPLRDRLADLETVLSAARSRVQYLTWVVAIEGVLIAVLVALLLLR